MDLLNINLPRYDILIGTGGIGSGSFFQLDGNHTLGRKSRSGHFLEQRDYCKLHIVSHILQSLVGRSVPTVPIGCIGKDANGQILYSEMQEAGLDLRFVEQLSGRSTLFSFCFLYPDGSGGNLSTADSASSAITPAHIDRAREFFAANRDRGIGYALPEAPLAARRRLLELSTEYGFYRTASFTSGELAGGEVGDLLDQIDLLALNLDEAAAAVDADLRGKSPREIVELTTRRLGCYPQLRLLITAEKEGSWTWDGSSLAHQPAWPVIVQASAGAGDAHLAGVLAGLCANLPLGQAHLLGSLVAAAAVTSPHTINKEMTRDTLRNIMEQNSVAAPTILRFLTEGEANDP